MHLLNIKVVEEHRCLKKGLSIDLQPITLLVGDQGSGKSTILECLHKEGEGRNKSECLELTLSPNSLINGVEVLYFDSENHNPRTKNPELYTTASGKDKGIGYKSALLSRWKSHGEVLKQFTVEPVKKAENAIVLLDEPESGLSIRNQYQFVKNIHLAKNCQFIIATHCLPLIESLEYVYSMEHLKWMKSKEFIDTQL